MNSYQAKQIPIKQFLESKGFNTTKELGNDSWYLSPFTEEKTPSFKVNKILNTFYCFSSGQGGTIIDLVIIMYSCNINVALNILSNEVNFSPASNQQSFNIG
jgi:DNA primase